MQLRKTINWILKLLILLILVAGAIASIISAIWTVAPDSSASKSSMLRYKSHCSFAPISTIILIFITILFSYILFKTKFLKLFN